MKQRTLVQIRGVVQGVGYRYATERQANRLGIRGWVRNLPDGSVEGCFEGDEPTLRSMIDWCKQGPSGASVTAVDIHWQEIDTPYTGFQIRR